MRFQLLAAQLARATLVLAVLAALVAVGGTRLGLMPFANGFYHSAPGHKFVTPADAPQAVA